MKNSVQHIIISALDDALDGNRFDASIFYQRWFQKDKSYLFLFKKNLKVTNISQGELLALLRIYTSSQYAAASKDIQFTSSREFKNSMQKLLDSFPI